MKITGKILIYTAFTIVALLVALYLRFPSDLIRQIVIEQVARAQPEARIDTERIALALPASIKFEPLAVTYADIPIVRIDSIRVTPRLLTMFGDLRRFGLQGEMGVGELRGTAETGFRSNRHHAMVTLNLTRVPLDFIEILYHWPGFLPQGALDATIKFDALKAGGTAEINMRVAPAIIFLDPPQMGIEELEFHRLEAQVTATASKVQIRNGEADGDQLEGKISGSIIFREPLEESRVTLTLTLKPRPAFLEEHKGGMLGGLLSAGSFQKRGLVLRITGTLNNPKYVTK